MSSLAWIDFDEAERQRAQRIMALFQERETRDELGLGGIRDSIADHLFPGTSTIQNHRASPRASATSESGRRRKREVFRGVLARSAIQVARPTMSISFA